MLRIFRSGFAFAVPDAISAGRAWRGAALSFIGGWVCFRTDIFRIDLGGYLLTLFLRGAFCVCAIALNEGGVEVPS